MNQTQSPVDHMIITDLKKGCSVHGPASARQSEILSPDALEFFAELHRGFNGRRLDLLQDRKRRRKSLERGEVPGLLPETRFVRETDWRVDPVPADLTDRRVEITGPVDRKMVINALNSGASCFMADFEDAHAPTWGATLEGQLNLRDAVRRTLEHVGPEGKRYRLNPEMATLLVRPRGWHLPEKHVRVDGEVASASIFDFALYFYHNVRERLEQGSGIYFYLPKMEHHLEARLWNDIFVQAQDALGVPQGTIKATVLIEHVLAAFQMEEILFELRHHSAGLNCGRWDYIFSYIKTFAHDPKFLVPDRAKVTMTAPFLRAYSLACIQACHKRCTFAIGGMAAFIPIKSDPEANQRALDKVREDKRREANDGHDGTWVAHPGLVSVAREEFDRVLGEKPNQIDRQRDDVEPNAEALLQVPEGELTEDGLRLNIRVGIQYLEAWLGGLGCVPLYNLMEDAATAEISRAQVWQWVHNPHAVLQDGRQVTLCLVEQMIEEEVRQLEHARKSSNSDRVRLAKAREIFEGLVASDTLEEFLTLKAYPLLD